MNKPTNSLLVHVWQVGVLILVRRCRQEIILLHRSVHLVDCQLQLRVVVVFVYPLAEPHPHHARAHKATTLGHFNALG